MLPLRKWETGVLSYHAGATTEHSVRWYRNNRTSSRQCLIRMIADKKLVKIYTSPGSLGDFGTTPSNAWPKMASPVRSQSTQFVWQRQLPGTTNNYITTERAAARKATEQESSGKQAVNHLRSFGFGIELVVWRRRRCSLRKTTIRKR
jgi:hypothetical protein